MKIEKNKKTQKSFNPNLLKVEATYKIKKIIESF